LHGGRIFGFSTVIAYGAMVPLESQVDNATKTQAQMIAIVKKWRWHGSVIAGAIMS
jgi:hypothetical protein